MRAGSLRLADGSQSYDSVALLQIMFAVLISMVTGDRRARHCALTADRAARGSIGPDHALESFVTPEQREGLRRQAAFWMVQRVARLG